MSEPTSFPFEEGRAEKRHAPATLRNREAIAAVLAEILPERGNVLEIASGTGEHIVHFAGEFDRLRWLPSDMAKDAISSINAWRAEAEQEGRADNIAPPLLLDVQGDWPALSPLAAIICINMLHISPWAAALALFDMAGRQLSAGAPLYIYGPFLQADAETSASNLAFDRSLKSRNARWGLRHLDDIAAAAQDSGFTLENVIEMPANNLSLIFRKM